MAESAPAADDLASRFIDVKVLSQLAPPHGTIHFHSILASTCVRELKVRVQDVIPTRPSVENLRFIHQGRVVARDSHTLVDVFGREAVQQAMMHTLHLVIREQQVSGIPPGLGQDGVSRTNTSALSAPANQVHATNQQPPSATITQTAAPQNGLSPQYQTIQSNLAQMQHLHNTGASNPHGPGVLPQTPFGMAASPSPSHLIPPQSQLHPGLTTQMMQGLPDLNHMIQQQIQQAIAASQANLGADHALMSRTATAQDHIRQNGSQPTERGPSVHNQGQSSQRTMETESTQESQGSQSSNAPSQRNVQPEAITRQGIGANGERWTFTTSTTTAPFPHQSGLSPLTQPQLAPQMQYLSHDLLGHQNPQFMTTSLRTNSPLQITGAGLARSPPYQAVPYLGWVGPDHAISYMQTLHGQFEAAMQAFRLRYASESDSGSAAPIFNGIVPMRVYINQRNRAQQVINNILTHGAPSGFAFPTAEQISRLQLLSDQFEGAVRDWRSNLTRFGSGQVDRSNPTSMSQSTSIATPSELTAASTTSSGAESTVSAPTREIPESQANSNVVTAYLLRSPVGPRAILYTQEGVFSSRPQPNPGVVSHARGLAEIMGGAGQVAGAGRAQQLALANQRRGVLLNDPFGQQLQGGQQQQQQGPNAIALNLTPFFQALWLFIRGYAFMWLFLGGGGRGGGIFSWRSAVLLALSFAYWGVQAGIGAHQIGVIRRYWNDLVGPGPVARQAQQERAARRVHAPGANPADGRGVELHPEERSFTQQQGQDGQGSNNGGDDLAERQGGPLREWLRLFERTIALFLASLYPGVGERHVEERDRARREAQERDRARAAAAAAAQDMQTQDSPQGQSESQHSVPSSQATEPGSDSSQRQTLPISNSGKKESASSPAKTDEPSSSSDAAQNAQNGIKERKSGNP